MLGEDRADFENKLGRTLEENDQMQKQIIEGQEEIEEAKRNFRESESKLAQVTRENEIKSEKLV